MPVNQLYHDHGVALTRAKHAVPLESRDGHAAEALIADHRILQNRASDHDAVIIESDRFETFRTEEVRVSSTQFSGGDWHWRLATSADETLVEGGGYRTEEACLEAVTLLRERASRAN
jgi:uncharacterized protein YegP (UPF0339 family)